MPRQTAAELLTEIDRIYATLGVQEAYLAGIALIAARDAEIAEEARREERERCAEIVNDARFVTRDLRSLVAEIKEPVRP